MKQIYFVLTDTGTVLSKIVKTFMKDEFGHVSISLDRKLNKMYSFGRINPYNPFYGGFVHEHIYMGTFKRFHKTKAKILLLNIKDEQYEKLEQIIKEMRKEKRKFKFNSIGLFGVYFKKKRKKENYFYCAEFVKYITEKAGINLKLPEFVRPDDFKKIKKTDTIYTGLLKEYC